MARRQLSEFLVPLPAFYQPVRNFAALKDLGINLVVGPCVENDKALTPDQYLAAAQAWINTATAMGFGIILKLPWMFKLTDSVVAFAYSVDEPNGKIHPVTKLTWTADDLMPEHTKMTAIDPTMPLLLTLAGDKITSNVKVTQRDYAAQVAYYLKMASICDVWAFDVYSKNRSDKYPVTWSADVVKILRDLAPRLPVWVWYECNDQQLPPPKLPEINRAPTPDEITDTLRAAQAAGAAGYGPFLTCDSGKYGWPDSFFPQVDRNKTSMAPQYDAVRQFNKLNASTFVPPLGTVSAPVPPQPPVVPAPPTLEQRVAGLEEAVRLLGLWKTRVQTDN